MEVEEEEQGQQQEEEVLSLSAAHAPFLSNSLIYSTCHSHADNNNNKL